MTKRLYCITYEFTAYAMGLSPADAADQGWREKDNLFGSEFAGEAVQCEAGQLPLFGFGDTIPWGAGDDERTVRERLDEGQ